MEIEVRQHEVVEKVAALHVALVGGPERDGDLAVGRAVDLGGVELGKRDFLGAIPLRMT